MVFLKARGKVKKGKIWNGSERHLEKRPLVSGVSYRAQRKLKLRRGWTEITEPQSPVYDTNSEGLNAEGVERHRFRTNII